MFTLQNVIIGKDERGGNVTTESEEIIVYAVMRCRTHSEGLKYSTGGVHGRKHFLLTRDRSPSAGKRTVQELHGPLLACGKRPFFFSLTGKSRREDRMMDFHPVWE